MSTVIIPHLDLVINMIEKNIFRPLPILKKAGLPGEGVGMEEVKLKTNSGIIARGSRLATLTTRLRVLLATYRQWWRWRQSPQSAHHSIIHPRIPWTFRLIITQRKRVLEKHFAQTLRKARSQKKNDQKGHQRLFLQLDSWDFQVQRCLIIARYPRQHYLRFRRPIKRITHHFLQERHHSTPQGSNLSSLPWTPDEMLHALLS